MTVQLQGHYNLNQTFKKLIIPLPPLVTAASGLTRLNPAGPDRGRPVLAATSRAGSLLEAVGRVHPEWAWSSHHLGRGLFF